MSLEVDWDFPARTVLLGSLPWPTSSAVAGEVHRFAAALAPSLRSGPYRFRMSGYLIHVRVDQQLGTVLVLGLYRAP